MDDTSHLWIAKIRVVNFDIGPSKVLLFRPKCDSEKSVYLDCPDDNSRENFSEEAYVRLLAGLQNKPMHVAQLNIWGTRFGSNIDLYQLYVRNRKAKSLSMINVYHDPYQMQYDTVQIRDFEQIVDSDSEIEFFAPAYSKTVFTFLCYHK